MKNNKKRTKRLAILLACILVPLGAFGFGYFLNKYKVEKQIAQTLTVEGSIGGTIADTNLNISEIVPGDIISQSIELNSTSTAPSLIRVKIAPTWEGLSSSNNIKLIYEDGVTVNNEIEDNKNEYWYKCDDGYLYYIGTVTDNKNMKLVKGIQFLGGESDEDANKYQDKKLTINVTMDMIQSKYGAFQHRWNVNDEELKNKLKGLCEEPDEVFE